MGQEQDGVVIVILKAIGRDVTVVKKEDPQSVGWVVFGLYTLTMVVCNSLIIPFFLDSSAFLGRYDDRKYNTIGPVFIHHNR